MDSAIAEIRWVGGMAFVGFLTLSGWIYYLQRVTVTSEDMKKSLREIKEALVGTYEKKGLITQVHEQDKILGLIKEKLEIA